MENTIKHSLVLLDLHEDNLLGKVSMKAPSVLGSETLSSFSIKKDHYKDINHKGTIRDKIYVHS